MVFGFFKKKKKVLEEPLYGDEGYLNAYEALRDHSLTRTATTAPSGLHKTVTVLVLGDDGAGKTSVARKLAQVLADDGVGKRKGFGRRDVTIKGSKILKEWTLFSADTTVGNESVTFDIWDSGSTDSNFQDQFPEYKLDKKASRALLVSYLLHRKKPPESRRSMGQRMRFWETNYEEEVLLEKETFQNVPEPDVVILVYDVENLSTFEGIQQHFRTFDKESKHLNNAANVTLLVIGAKHKAEAPARVVSRSEGRRRARELQCSFLEIATGDSDKNYTDSKKKQVFRHVHPRYIKLWNAHRSALFEILVASPDSDYANLEKELKLLLVEEPEMRFAQETSLSESAVSTAARLGKPRMVSTLLGLGFPMDLVSDHDQNVFHAALMDVPGSGDLNMPTVKPQSREGVLKELFKHCPSKDVLKNLCDQRSRQGITPFHLAVSSGLVWVVQEFLKVGASLAIPDKDMRSPVHLACMIPKDKGYDVLKVLAHAEASFVPIKPQGGGKGANKDKSAPSSPRGSMQKQRSTRLTELFSYSLKEGENPKAAWFSSMDNEGRTPLHLACGAANVKCAALLLQADPDCVSGTDRLQYSAIHRLCSAPVEDNAAAMDLMDMLLEKAKTVVAEIVREEDDISAEKIAEKRAKETQLNAGNMSFSSPTKIRRKSYEVVEHTLANAPDLNGNSPLHMLAMSNNVPLLSHFLKLCVDKYTEQNIDFAARNRRFLTPLMAAIRKDPSNGAHNSKVEIVAALLRYGEKEGKTFNVDDVNQNKATALHICGSFKGWSHMAPVSSAGGVHIASLDGGKRDRLQSMGLDIVNALLSAGADPEKHDKWGRSALHKAATGGSVAICEALLRNAKKRADPNTADQKHWTPLFYAVEGGRQKVVEHFITSHRVNAGLTDIDANSLLHIACMQRHTEVAQMLYNFGANPLLANGRGLTSFYYAAKGRMNGVLSRFMTYNGGVHPFSLVHTGAGTKRPLVLALSELDAPIESIKDALDLFIAEKDHVAGGKNIYYDFAISPEGFEYLMSGDGKRAIFQLLGSKNKTLLGNPAIQYMMELLWNHYCRKRFIFDNILYLAMITPVTLLALMIGFDVPNNPGTIFVRWMLGIVTALFGIKFLFMEIQEFVNVPKGGLLKHMMDPWNTTSVAGFVMLILCSPYFMWYGIPWESEMLSILILVLWLRILEFLAAYRPTSTTVRILVRMTGNIVYFMTFMGVFIMGFGLGFLILLAPEGWEGYETVGGTLINMWQFLLGNGDFDTVRDVNDFIVTTYFILYSCACLLMINMLIATMTTSYESIRQDADSEFLIDRGMAIIKVLPRDRDMYDTRGFVEDCFPTLASKLNNRKEDDFLGAGTYLSGRLRGILESALYRLPEGMTYRDAVEQLAPSKYLPEPRFASDDDFQGSTQAHNLRQLKTLKSMLVSSKRDSKQKMDDMAKILTKHDARISATLDDLTQRAADMGDLSSKLGRRFNISYQEKNKH